MSASSSSVNYQDWAKVARSPGVLVGWRVGARLFPRDSTLCGIFTVSRNRNSGSRSGYPQFDEHLRKWRSSW